MSEDSLLERKLAEIAASSYLNRLGIRVALAEDGAGQIALPYTEANTNRGGSIHGGTIASAFVVAGSLAAASSQSPDTKTRACEGRPLNVAISFLRPVQAEDITARATVLRRGRDTVHVASDVYSADAAHVATGFVTYRISVASAEASDDSDSAPTLAGDQFARFLAAEPQRMSGSPYGRAAGIEVLAEKPYRACIQMPLTPNEGVGDYIHEGAIAGLIDNCGAFSSYTHPRASRKSRGATVAMYLSYVAPVAGGLQAVARLMARTGSTFTSHVEVRGVSRGALSTLASVSYRITQ